MPYEKLRLLEARIGDAARLLEELRRVKRDWQRRYRELRDEVASRQVELDSVRRESAEFEPMLDQLLDKLDALQVDLGEAGDDPEPPSRETLREAAPSLPSPAAASSAAPAAKRRSSPAQEEEAQEEEAEEPQATPRSDAAIVDIATDDVDSEPAEAHLEHFDRGIHLEDAGNFEAAISAYREALTTAPDFVDAIERLAFLLEKVNREEEASPLWDKVLALKKPG